MKIRFEQPPKVREVLINNGNIRPGTGSRALLLKVKVR